MPSEDVPVLRLRGPVLTLPVPYSVAINPPRFVAQVQGWMTPEELEILYRTAVQLPTRMGFLLEVGSWKGLSGFALASAGPTICIDHFRGSQDHQGHGEVDTFPDFQRNLREVGLHHRVIVVRMDSHIALPALFGTPVRLALIDGSHGTGDVLLDLEGAWQLLSPGGRLFVDDYQWESVARALEIFSGTHGISFAGIGSTKLARLDKPV